VSGTEYALGEFVPDSYFRRWKAQLGVFPGGGIEDSAFDSAQRWATSLGFPNGPFALSVDDTKVTAGIRSFKDTVWKIGGMHGRVETFESYDELLDKAKISLEDIGDKVCWSSLRYSVVGMLIVC
jgi:hypothetical protein